MFREYEPFVPEQIPVRQAQSPPITKPTASKSSVESDATTTSNRKSEGAKFSNPNTIPLN